MPAVRGWTAKALALCLTAAAAACSTAVDLPYAPAIAPTSSGPPVISGIVVTDARSERDPTYVGAIRGGYLNPLKTLVTATPIADEVRLGFERALAARGLLGRRGPDTLSITLSKLSANQLFQRVANAAFSLDLQDPAGRSVYHDVVDVEEINGTIISLDQGIFASIDDLRAIMVLTLTEAIDRALDKPGFIAAATKPGS